MLIANARMYSVNAQAATAWRSLLEWVIERAGVPAEAIDYPPPHPMAALNVTQTSAARARVLQRFELSHANDCGEFVALGDGAFGASSFEYCGNIVEAREADFWAWGADPDAPWVELDDIFGQRFAYTIEDSQSGYQAARELLAPYARERGGSLFAATVGPLITPRRVAEAIIAGEADVGPLDSYAHDLIRAHEPELAAQLRTIATTPPTPIPPLVAAPGVAAADVERLRAALLDIAQAGELQSIRSALLLDGFVLVEPDDYGVLLVRARVADRYGYSRLA